MVTILDVFPVTEHQTFLGLLKSQVNELIVPLDTWNKVVRGRGRLPLNRVGSEFVVTERDLFIRLARREPDLCFVARRGSKFPGVWFGEFKSPPKVICIMDYAHRQQGSFRSRN